MEPMRRNQLVLNMLGTINVPGKKKALLERRI
jgi:hypothetical protein